MVLVAKQPAGKAHRQQQQKQPKDRTECQQETDEDASRVVLAFGVGFSYQLGLDEADIPTTRGGASPGGAVGVGPTNSTLADASSQGVAGGRLRTIGGREVAHPPHDARSNERAEEVRICASIQRLPKEVPVQQYLKKEDSPAFVAAGASHSVLLTREGKLFRWGMEDGEIHRRPTGVCTQIPLPCIEVCCGRKHTMALMKGGFVMTWGTGYFGQLGHGDNASYRHPRLLRRLEPQRLGERVVQVACGGYHSAVVTDAGRAFSWGFNRYGQCGNGSKDNTVPEPCLVDMSVVSPGRMGEVPKVLCGRHHSALVSGSGALYTWGACSFGKLGLQDPEKAVCAPQEVTFFREKPLLQAAAGDYHMVALSRRREVFTWGYGAEGQGGHGRLLPIRTPRRVSSLQDVPIAQVVCGPSWSMAVTIDGYCYSWGCADGGWTGLERPAGLSVVDPTPANERVVETQSFDSCHNVHVPTLVYSLAPYRVLQVGCGGGHTLVVATCRVSSTLEAHHEDNGSHTATRFDRDETRDATAPSGESPEEIGGGSSSGGGAKSSPAKSAAGVHTSASSPPASLPSASAQRSSGSTRLRSQAVRTNASSSAHARRAGRSVDKARQGSGRDLRNGDFPEERPPEDAPEALPSVHVVPGAHGSRVTSPAPSLAGSCSGDFDAGGAETERNAPQGSARSGGRAAHYGGTMVENGVHDDRPPSSTSPPRSAQPMASVQAASSDERGQPPEESVAATDPSRDAGSRGPRASASMSVAQRRSVRRQGEAEPGGNVNVSGIQNHRVGLQNGDSAGQSVDESWRSLGTARGKIPTNPARDAITRDEGASGGGGGGGDGSSAGDEAGVGHPVRDTDPEHVAKVFSYCRHGRLEQVQLALGAGFDVCRLRDENGNTLLHCAAQNGLRSMCKAVLKDGSGRPLNLKNNRGNTALHYAYAFGFQQLGKYLATNGADDTLVNNQGLTCYEGLDRQDLEPL